MKKNGCLIVVTLSVLLAELQKKIFPGAGIQNGFGGLDLHSCSFLAETNNIFVSSVFYLD
jgi:hypothetical protein